MPYQHKIIIDFLIFFLVLLLPAKTAGQTNDIILDESYDNLSWIDFISKVERNYPVHFYFEADSLTNFKVSIPKKAVSFMDQLNAILRPYEHKAAMDAEGNLFVTRNISIKTSLPDNFFQKQETKSPSNNIREDVAGKQNGYLTTVNTYVNKYNIIGEKTNDNKPTATVSGYLKNLNDNSPLVGVFLYIKETGISEISDAVGFYSLNLKKGDYTMVVNSLETKEITINLRVLSDGRLDLKLEPKLITLDAVIVSSQKEHVVRSTNMGYQKLMAKDVKEIPLVLGEKDIVKVSLLLPGIQSVGEGSSGLNVRGSPTDHNLFILNNVPVYNSSHLLGFFSAFNSDAIQDFTLYKSNIPAGYGGRLSSIFDIRTKQGNQNHFTASGGISPVSARLIVEGPISKGNSSYLIGLRSTYSDWILSKVDDPDISNSNAMFGDLVTNFSFALNKNNQLNIFSYHSVDEINLMNQNKYNYSNNGGSVSLSHLIKEKHSLQVALIYSQYDFTEKNTEMDISAYKDNFQLSHGELKTNLTIRPNDKHTITAGINSMLYLLDQGDFSPLNEESLVNPVALGKEKALESAVFLSDEWVLTPKITLVGGLRYNYYMYLGPQEMNVYSSDEPRSMKSVIDTATYSNNQVVKTYGAPDFRFAARYIIRDDLSLKLSFNQLKQYLFMLSNTIAVSPTDKWKLSDKYIKPMSGNQYSVGLYKSIQGGKYDISVETYYKTVKNLVEYKDGANLVVNETPEIDVLQGDLKSYGIEFMINKPTGRLNGWLNYTYSRALVTVDSKEPLERINYGETYPSNYDKPHAINVVANYKFSRRFSMSSNVVYSTGRPITYPVGVFYQEESPTPLYSKRNEYRIPDYFRIDFSLKLEGNLEAKKFAHGTWMFSVYNLTGRKNAYSVYFKTEDGTMKGKKLSIFGVPIVSLTYSFKLGNYAN